MNRRSRWARTLVATILGIGGGLLVAKLLIAAFNAAGAGFSSPQTASP